MIWIEHDMQMIADLADRIHVLDYGRTIAEGVPDVVLTNPEVCPPILVRPILSWRRFHLSPEGLDEIRNSTVIRRDLGEALRILQRGPDVAAITIEGNQSEQQFAVCGMLCQIVLKHRIASSIRPAE